MQRPVISFALLVAGICAPGLTAQTPAAPGPPPTLRSVLLRQLQTTHNKADWFTPANAAVAGMTAEQAKWVPHNATGKVDPENNHSAGMLAYHLVFWNERALQQMRGQKPPDFKGQNDETFNDFNAAQWNDIVKRLDAVLNGLESEVANMPQDKLEKFAPMIANISTHNAYHTGQILYVRKLQGSWNPANGVK